MPTTYIPTLVYEKAHTEAIWDVVWSKRTNLIVTGGADDLVKCWDGTSGELKYTLEGHSLGVHSVDTNHDGSRALSSSLDSTICIWDLENNGALVTSIKPGALQSWRAKFSPDGKHCASGSHTGDLNVYSVENGEKVASYTSKTNFAMCVAYSPDGKYLAGGADDGSISVFDVETNQLIHSLPAHSMAVRDLTFAPDGRTLISGSDDRCINVYDVEHGQLASVLTATNDWVLSVAANPDISKQQLASGSGDNKIRIWDLSMRSLLEIHEDHTDEVWGVAWNPEGTKLVSASADTSIKWFASSGSS